VAADDGDACFIAPRAVEMAGEEIRPHDAELQMRADRPEPSAARDGLSAIAAMALCIPIPCARACAGAIAAQKRAGWREIRDVRLFAHTTKVTYVLLLFNIFFLL
jgi:hypothetical protein